MKRKQEVIPWTSPWDGEYYPVGKPRRKRKSRAKGLHLETRREWRLPITLVPVNAAGQPAPLTAMSITRLSGKGEAEITGPGSFKVWCDAKPRKGAKSTRTVFEVSADVDLDIPIQAERLVLKVEGE